MRIGMIAMSAKPFHKGHAHLITSALQECDIVNVYVSMGDRKRRGEITIFGSDMRTIWNTYIRPYMPSNVNIVLLDKIAPVSAVWNELGASDLSDKQDTYLLYGDTDDAANRFSDELLSLYVPRLVKEELVELRPISRSQTGNVSGTAMRSAIENCDKAAFRAGMPRWLDVNAVWHIFRSRLNEQMH